MLRQNPIPTGIARSIHGVSFLESSTFVGFKSVVESGVLDFNSSDMVVVASCKAGAMHWLWLDSDNNVALGQSNKENLDPNLRTSDRDVVNKIRMFSGCDRF